MIKTARLKRFQVQLLVADVGADGKPTHVEVMPATPVAKCMAGQFTTWTLPRPPADPAHYPIEIDYSIAK